MDHGTYIGSDPRLQGEAALLRDDPESKTRGVLAQFDNLHLKESHGWHSFYNYDFRYDK